MFFCVTSYILTLITYIFFISTIQNVIIKMTVCTECFCIFFLGGVNDGHAMFAGAEGG